MEEGMHYATRTETFNLNKNKRCVWLNVIREVV